MKILSLYTHYPSSVSIIIDDKIVAATHEASKSYLDNIYKNPIYIKKHENTFFVF